jgi:15-cis-phytoene desaturase
MKVIVIGGGVAGMIGAHELAVERKGFDVTVYEYRDRPGGKARSMPVPTPPAPGNKPLPGEHGFRVFFGFYQHITEALGRIPARDGGSVRELLVETSEVGMTRYDGPMMHNVPRPPRDLGEWLTVFKFAVDYMRALDLNHDEPRLFVKVMNNVASSCRRRKEQQHEAQSWWDFSGASAEGRSEDYGKFLADGLSRSLAATRARELSARSGGNTLLQMFMDMTRRDGAPCILPGPTSDLWLDPWLDQLRAAGVNYQLNHKVEGVDVRAGRVHGIRGHQASWPGGKVKEDHPFEDEADYYVLAVPVEVVTDRLELGELKEESYGIFPQLHSVEPRWMNGVLFYLREVFPTVPGHIIHIDSPWALTSINQPQFWSGIDLASYGDGSVRDIISICVSEWFEKGEFIKKEAKDCSKEEIRDEVFRQLRRGFEEHGLDLREDMVSDWYLDEDITWPNPSDTANLEPLMVNTPNSLHSRPRPEVPTVPNLFLAADYVRTETDVATMEAANEAARLAVNALLAETGSEDRCEIYERRELGGYFERARRKDDENYQPAGEGIVIPPPPKTVELVDGELVWHEDPLVGGMVDLRP